MIERVALENFQCHKSLIVDLDRYVTTFTGPSDRGKSAVLRALRWVMANPAGAAFVRHGAKTASATVTADGVPIVRRRGSDNVYVFGGETYASLRAATVPDKIAQLLNLSSVAFMGQHDGPFWLTETPGQVSRNLNTVINLGEIDDALARAAADVRRLRADVDASERVVGAAKAKRDQLAWAPQFADAVASLVELETAATEIERRVRRLRELMAEADRRGAECGAWDRVVRLGTDAALAGSAVVERDRAADKLAELIDRAGRLAATAGTDPTVAWDRLLKLRAAGDAAAGRFGELSYLIADADKWEDQQCEADAELQRLEAELAAACAGKCPLCGANADPLHFSPPTGMQICDALPPAPKRVTDGVEYSLPTSSGSRR